MADSNNNYAASTSSSDYKICSHESSEFLTISYPSSSCTTGTAEDLCEISTLTSSLTSTTTLTQSTTDMMKPGMTAEIDSSHPKCPLEYVVLSKHPVHSEYVVKIIPIVVENKFADHRIIFGVWNNTVKKASIMGGFNVFETTTQFRNLDEEVFRKFIRRGLLFTKLELNGHFFGESYLCAQSLDAEHNYTPIVLPNLKHLIINMNLSATYMGVNTEFNTVYLEKHDEDFGKIWARASWNLWYILKTITSLKLQSFVLDDTVKWEGIIGFRKYYKGVLMECQKPLFEFLQRNGPTLKSFRISPALMTASVSPMKDVILMPQLDELRFSAKMLYELKTNLSEEQKTIMLKKSMNASLEAWREFLMPQVQLKKLEWVCSKYNPWKYTRKDFVHLCKMNTRLGTVVVNLFGHHSIFKKYEIQEPLFNFLDLEFNCLWLQELSVLKTLAISCFDTTDNRNEQIRIVNLDLLPKSLEHLNFFGLQIRAAELEHLGDLPRLKNLSIMQRVPVMFNAPQELRGEIEGISLGALKKIIHIRSLNQLALTGFPTRKHVENYGFHLLDPIDSGSQNPELVLGESTIAVARNRRILSWLTKCFDGAKLCVDTNRWFENDPDESIEACDLSYNEELIDLLEHLKAVGSVYEVEVFTKSNIITVVAIGSNDKRSFDELFYFSNP